MVTAEGDKGQKQRLEFMLKRHFPKMSFQTLLYFQNKDPLCLRAKAELQKGLIHPKGKSDFCIIEDILLKKSE